MLQVLAGAIRAQVSPRGETGQAMVEYVMIIGSISILLVGAFVVSPTLTTPIQALIGSIAAFISPAP